MITTSKNIVVANEDKDNTIIAIMSTCPNTSETAWQFSPSALYFLPSKLKPHYQYFILLMLYSC